MDDTSEEVLSKVLRSLNSNWKNIVPAIMESKDLSAYSFDGLMGSLLSHENWVKKDDVKVEEKAFQVKA